MRKEYAKRKTTQRVVSWKLRHKLSIKWPASCKHFFDCTTKKMKLADVLAQWISVSHLSHFRVALSAWSYTKQTITEWKENRKIIASQRSFRFWWFHAQFFAYNYLYIVRFHTISTEKKIKRINFCETRPFDGWLPSTQSVSHKPIISLNENEKRTKNFFFLFRMTEQIDEKSH